MSRKECVPFTSIKTLAFLLIDTNNYISFWFPGVIPYVMHEYDSGFTLKLWILPWITGSSSTFNPWIS